MRKTDTLFLEMAGCVDRDHAPLGHLVFIGKAPARAHYMQKVREEAMFRAAKTIRPDVKAGEVYRAWQDRVDRAGLKYDRRHHCGYSVDICFPPSWSGSGTPQGLRNDSQLEIKPGMVLHLMSWLLRAGRGDPFLSDAIVVTDTGCEFLTTVSRSVTVR
jgi:Xaa-Pro dipeptidase